MAARGFARISAPEQAALIQAVQDLSAGHKAWHGSSAAHGVDWPIDYLDLKPYYQHIEAELPVARDDWPWGDPHRYPHRPHRVGGNGTVFLRGALAAGIQARVGPVAIPNGRFGNRPHCIYRGFCLQGCKVNAKASPLITHIPDALARGAEIRADSHVSAVTIDDTTGAATGVTYLRAGVEHHQRAAAVVVAGYSIETPRLLLLSTSAHHTAVMTKVSPGLRQTGRV